MSEGERSEEITTFVLIHGAGDVGWYWHPFSRARARGRPFGIHLDYMVGPILGAVTAVVIVYAVHGRYSEAEAEKAAGDSTKHEEERAGDEATDRSP